MFKDMIRKLRLDKGMTQEAVARMADISRINYIKIEMGKQDTRLSVALKIARALGLDKIPVAKVGE